MIPGSSRSERVARRRDRKLWPVRIVRQGENVGDDLSSTTTASQRVQMVDELTRTAWELSGQPWPDYKRADMPIHVLSIAQASE